MRFEWRMDGWMDRWGSRMEVQGSKQRHNNRVVERDPGCAAGGPPPLPASSSLPLPHPRPQPRPGPARVWDLVTLCCPWSPRPLPWHHPLPLPLSLFQVLYPPSLPHSPLPPLFFLSASLLPPFATYPNLPVLFSPCSVPALPLPLPPTHESSEMKGWGHDRAKWSG